MRAHETLHRSRRLVVSAVGWLALAGVTVAVACGPANDPQSSSDGAHQLPPDKTEVKMEVTAVTGTVEEPKPPASAAGATSASPVAAPFASPSASATPTATSDPAEDANIGGSPKDAKVEKALTPIRPRLRACYKKALATEPNLAGTAVFDATIGKDGKVASARFVKRDGLTEDMVGCLTTAVKAMVFAVGQKSQIVPLSFGAASGAADGGVKP